MASPWMRLWADMINDPKWRTIARVSGQKIGDVISTYLHMMTCASNATERGRTEGWNDEDIATALDIETGQVTAIREAMQGRVLDGDYLTGWSKRQPVREDGAAERAKAWREDQKAAKQTQSNATERNQTLEEIREEKIKKRTTRSKAEAATGTRLPADWHPTDDDVAYCKTERPDLLPSKVAQNFFDYWTAKPGKDGRKADWSATWRSWVRKENGVAAARTSTGAWWASDATIIAKGAELAMRPLPGEAMVTFKGRIQASIDGVSPTVRPLSPVTVQDPVRVKASMPEGLNLRALVKPAPELLS